MCARAPQYQPTADDLVVGVVCEKNSESYRVDIGGPELATLPALAFEGATKRNKPNIAVRHLITTTLPSPFNPTCPLLTLPLPSPVLSFIPSSTAVSSVPTVIWKPS